MTSRIKVRSTASPTRGAFNISNFAFEPEDTLGAGSWIEGDSGIGAGGWTGGGSAGAVSGADAGGGWPQLTASNVSASKIEVNITNRRFPGFIFCLLQEELAQQGQAQPHTICKYTFSRLHSLPDWLRGPG